MDNSYITLKEIAGGITLLYADADPAIGQKLLPVLRYFFKEVDLAYS